MINDYKFISIPAGTFQMGGQHRKLSPRCLVTLSKPFKLLETPVTWALWREFDPSHEKSRNDFPDDFPITGVTFLDVIGLIERCRDKHGIVFRLPTEAEWEYAYRANTTTECYWGNGRLVPDWNEYGVFEQKAPTRVKTKKPNGYGLYDMAGLVWAGTGTNRGECAAGISEVGWFRVGEFRR